MFTDLFVAAAVAAAVGWFGLGMDPCERWCYSPASPVVVVCVSGSARPRPPRRSISKSVEQKIESRYQRYRTRVNKF